MALDHHQLEEGQELHLDFAKLTKIGQTDNAVIPVAVQDIDSKSVLLIGYVNEQALQYAIENRIATFWSTSRNELWIKGATSGDSLELVDVRVNCEQNSLLYLVRLKGGGSCHTKDANANTHRYGCYYRSIQNNNLTFTNPKTIPE
ncbi:MAG: phosphoribosyl-AMP cyclohydrolase [Candidatus Latescibacteria bacterium]|mgnify:FL=1|jgi:phosphoribosyl-AMP cyclohydrolase|nr:phosphoribosyl-AMP cyclohydrolase [Candidatus Latescibacterota bacterium]MBT4137624.1 phosphoribosyl-AMP cyclohydrolase [Candidatus Latescibacterota bacterium]MBT5832159.1 phosphoribosyl-AMP cyclohydrolase [Candidatus Latescibacterota bacterium]